MEVGEDGLKVGGGASEDQSCLPLGDIDQVGGDDAILLVQRGRGPRQLNGHMINSKAVDVLGRSTRSCNRAYKLK